MIEKLLISEFLGAWVFFFIAECGGNKKIKERSKSGQSRVPMLLNALMI